MLATGLAKIVWGEFIIQEGDSSLRNPVCSGVLMFLEQPVLNEGIAATGDMVTFPGEIQCQGGCLYPDTTVPDNDKDTPVRGPQPVNLPMHFVRFVGHHIDIETGSGLNARVTTLIRPYFHGQMLSASNILVLSEANCGPVTTRVPCRKRTPTQPRRARMEPRNSGTKLMTHSNPSRQKRTDTRKPRDGGTLARTASGVSGRDAPRLTPAEIQASLNDDEVCPTCGGPTSRAHHDCEDCEHESERAKQIAGCDG